MVDTYSNKKGKHNVNNMPCKHQVLKNTKFGKPYLNHSFKSEAMFEHIIIFLLKSKYLSDQEEVKLSECHPLFSHLNKMLKWSSNIDFSDINQPIKDYHLQTSIDQTRVKKMLAGVLHYELDIPIFIRFLGGNYTAEYRNVSLTLRWLRASNCDQQIIADIERIMTVGCPNTMNASSTRM